MELNTLLFSIYSFYQWCLIKHHCSTGTVKEVTPKIYYSFNESVWFLILGSKIQIVVLYVGFRACFRIHLALGNWWWCGAGVMTEEHAHFLPSQLLKEGDWRHPPHSYFMSALSFFLPHPFLKLLHSADSSGAWEGGAIAWYNMVFKCSVFESKSLAS